MNSNTIKLFLLILFVSSGNWASAQLAESSGQVCMLDSINGPTLLCDFSDLNTVGYEVLPPIHDAEPQPPGQLCDTGGGTQGQPDNIVWYAFQADCEDISITIDGRNCSKGIQAGIFTDCTFTERVDCSSASLFNITLSNSNPLVVGQTYYLFLDGYEGGECEYMIQAETPCNTDYTIEDLTAIQSDFLSDGETICQGLRASFHVGMHSGNHYHWTVTDNATSTVIYDIHLGKEDFNYSFENEGSFTVSVQAYDDCSTTNTVTFNVNVELMEDEIFQAISVCGECFPFNLESIDPDCIISGTLYDQDPNGDGVLGWGKSTVVMSGNTEIVDTITLMSGCFYRQVIYIEDLGVNSRVTVDSFLCEDDFPIEFNGNFYNAGESANVTEDWAAANGCDAFYKYNFNAIEINGDFITDCMDGDIQLGFDIDEATSSPLSNLQYQWLDSGNSVVSTDSFINNTIIGENYTLEISIDDVNYACMFTYSKTIENGDLNPPAPIIDSEIILCSNQDEIKIYVNEDRDINYIWALSDNLEFVTNGTKDTITVKNPEKDFTFTVYSVNECGQSESVTGDVIFTEAPEADFDMPIVVCKDSIFTIANLTSAGGLNFDWELASAQYQSGDITIANGSAEYSFDSVGDYEITLISDNGSCFSDPITKTIRVVELPDTPDVICDNEIANQLSFTWDVEDWMVGYSFDFNGVYNDNFLSDEDNGRIIFDGLTAEEEITVTITFDYGASCGIVQRTISCTSKACAPTSVRILPGQSEICFTEDMPSIQVVPTVDIPGTWSGNYIDDNGVFDPNEAGIGQHDVFFKFTEESCSHEVNTRITVLPRPFYVSEVTYEDCPQDDDLAEVSVYVNSGIGQLTYYINGEEEVGPIFNLSAGIYNLEIEDSNGCTFSDMIEIEDRNIKSVDIKGSLKVKSFENEEYELTISDGFAPTTIEWTMDGEVICNDTEFCSPDFMIDNGIVQLCATASDNVCTVSDCIDVRIYTPIEFNLPNAFSPNSGYGNGDYMIGSTVSNTEILGFSIFDRYGNKMHTITDFILDKEMMPVWDGTYNGKIITPGVYVFILEYLDENGDKNVKTGDITVVN